MVTLYSFESNIKVLFVFGCVVILSISLSLLYCSTFRLNCSIMTAIPDVMTSEKSAKTKQRVGVYTSTGVVCLYVVTLENTANTEATRPHDVNKIVTVSKAVFDAPIHSGSTIVVTPAYVPVSKARSCCRMIAFTNANPVQYVWRLAFESTISSYQRVDNYSHVNPRREKITTPSTIIRARRRNTQYRCAAYAKGAHRKIQSRMRTETDDIFCRWARTVQVTEIEQSRTVFHTVGREFDRVQWYTA